MIMKEPNAEGAPKMYILQQKLAMGLLFLIFKSSDPDGSMCIVLDGVLEYV